MPDDQQHGSGVPAQAAQPFGVPVQPWVAVPAPHVESRYDLRPKTDWWKIIGVSIALVTLFGTMAGALVTYGKRQAELDKVSSIESIVMELRDKVVLQTEKHNSFSSETKDRLGRVENDVNLILRSLNLTRRNHPRRADDNP